jgi:phenylacetate-CoA ligase
VLGTTLARLRLATSVTFGTPISVRSLDRMVDAAHARLDESGAVDGGRADVVGGAAMDPGTRRNIAEKGLRRQCIRAAREAPYYEQLFKRLELDPSAVTLDNIEELPLTSKQALRERPDAFVCRDSRPYLCALTTGTTGRPASVAYSRREIEAYASMSALHGLASGQLRQHSVRSRSTRSWMSLSASRTL